ncbi:MAG: FHA domain-containing protein [Myxococcales bacterium]|nr:FHA domain-containing protein [Myxococcales bacterium]
MARGTTLQIGSALDYANDMVFRGDPLIAPYHCVIEEQAEAFILSDLGAKSGVFVRVHGRHRLSHGSELLVGRTRLLVDLSPSDPSLQALG